MSSSSRTRSPVAVVPMRVEEAIGIARPPDQVWAVVADPRNDPRWCRKVKTVDAAGERRWHVMHKPIPLRPPRELELKQLAASAPPIRAATGGLGRVFNVEYRLEHKTGTRLTQVSEFAWKGLPRLLQGTFGRAVRREVRSQLRTLQTLLERDGPHDG
jgi:uncharacterized protein YndB with AHSA1/START domain